MISVRFPRRTVRLRLTLLYGSLFLVSGVALLAITYGLVARTSDDTFFLNRPPSRRSVALPRNFKKVIITGSSSTFPISRSAHAQLDHLLAQTRRQHAADLHELLTGSATALAGMVLISLALGWLVAGRALQPLRTMTSAARRISERNLHERLAVQGPSDELKELGDTVDVLLGRLEAAFEAQRRFVANASHELRTPLTLGRAVLEANVSDPEATIDSFRATSERLIAINEEQESLIDALLTLASSERGLESQEILDLAALTEEILHRRRAEIAGRDLRFEANLNRASISGDIHLVERLLANLVDNALCHNLPGGYVEIATGSAAERSFVSIANSGPAIPPDAVELLFQPFQRLGNERARHSERGHGLGLSIVKAIADAHRATMSVHALPAGGLDITVGFPRRDDADHPYEVKAAL